MKQIYIKDDSQVEKSSEEIRSALVLTRPTKIDLKRAIEKSLKKNKEALKILSKK